MEELPPRIRGYMASLEEGRVEAMELAESCRALGEDPLTEVEIPSAEDLADRVESLMEIDGLAGAIRSYGGDLGREEVAFRVAEDITGGRFGDMDGLEAVEESVRTAVAILTEGVVAAPIEGIDRVEAVEGGGVKIYFSGPIRSAGGTAQAVAVLVADYVRQTLGLEPYEATGAEVERAKEEIPLYKKEANLQYGPSQEEIEIIMENCPVMITGEPTEDAEVSGQRNLPRVETNRLRGGFALVIAEGLALKAAKLQKFVDLLGIDGWGWLSEIAKENSAGAGGRSGDKFLSDLIAGRPVFSHPSEAGGFRLRYGRSRNTGLATAGLNPATMRVADDFLAPGTQLKTQMPGKAAGVAPVDAIEGPTVRLDDGTVMRVDEECEMIDLRERVEKVLDLGEILLGAGEFLENNRSLALPGFTEEQWRLEAEGPPPKSGEEAVERARMEPLHPRYTYLWHDLSAEEALELREGLSEGLNPEHKPLLETLLVPHRLEDGSPVIEGDHRVVLEACLPRGEVAPEGSGLKAVRNLSGLDVRSRAPTRVGARMGRPEKSREREMNPPVHCLLPLGEAGGSTRNVVKAVRSKSRDTERGVERVTGRGVVEVEVPVQDCECGFRTYRNRCPECGERLERSSPSRNELELAEDYGLALQRLGERSLELVKGVKGLTSPEKVPEPLEKGMLRAIHGVSIFKDGTIRYDLTDLPLTHFKPSEVGTPVDRLRDLGYREDVNGEPLKSDGQALELLPQDVVLSEDCGDYLLKAASFVDDLLERFYGQEPFYRAESREDLIGELLIGLAPHTSAGVLCRLVGFTSAQAGYAHPYLHAAKRRNCDGDEDCYMLLLDGYLNFSRSYLPESRGGRMDAPLVLTTRIDPKEVDDEAHNLDVAPGYPLEFYEAAKASSDPGDIAEAFDRVDDRLGTPGEMEGFSYSHETSRIDAGPDASAYKTLGTMEEKSRRQLDLGARLRPVDEADVATRVVETHFLPDLIGNLRAFTSQKVRCVSCNTKYRRPPISGRCGNCGSGLTLTVHEGSVKKYLDISKALADSYDLSGYTVQRISSLEREIESVFENDKYSQTGIGDFM